MKFTKGSLHKYSYFMWKYWFYVLISPVLISGSAATVCFTIFVDFFIIRGDTCRVLQIRIQKSLYFVNVRQWVVLYDGSVFELCFCYCFMVKHIRHYMCMCAEQNTVSYKMNLFVIDFVFSGGHVLSSMITS